MSVENKYSAGWKTKLIFMTFGITFALGSIETGMRILISAAEPFELGEIEDWNPMDDSQFTPQLNELRFRQAPIEESIFGEGYIKVLFLGDSFTFGQGVSDGQDRFSNLLEKELNTNLGIKIHIYNASRPGTEPKDWVNFYNLVQPNYQPDHVFAIFFLRDGTDLCTSFRCYEDVLSQIRSKYTNRFFYKHSYVGKYFYNQAIVQEFSDFYANQIKDAYLGNETRTATWKSQQAALRQLHELCIKDDSSFNLIIFPLLYKLDENYPFYDVEDEIIRFANEANIPVYSLTSGFIGNDAQELWISDSDQHPNEQGHRIAANTLLPYLKEVIEK